MPNLDFFALFLSSDGPLTGRTSTFAGITKYEGQHHCMTCGYKSQYRWNVVTHYKLKHLPQKPTPCHICKQVFRNPLYRDNHLKRDHGISKGLMKAARSHSEVPPSYPEEDNFMIKQLDHQF